MSKLPPVKLLSVALAAAIFGSGPVLAAPEVVATIKPIHSLVAAVMGDVAAPDLIVRGGASPHTYSLRPSDARALEAADIVFWTGHGMELFLEESLASLAARATVVELAKSPGIELRPVREGGTFDAHGDDDHNSGLGGEDHAGEDAHPQGDDDEHGDAHVEGMDMHFWLDPVNAKHMVAQIAAALSAADPSNASAYAANAATESDRLDRLIAEVDAQLEPTRDVPFVVFHDAYQYFEERFGLNIAGSITVTPDTMPGAARIAEIRARLADLSAACVFAEPQFEPAIVETIIEGTAARSGTLDPEGASLTEGPDLYAELIRNLAAGLADCLGAQ